MKLQILDIDGKKKKEITTELFEEQIRQDLIQKVVECEKRKQPYAPFWLAGKQASASGNIRHGRRKWKTAYGKGISRVPRKIFWRRGTQFYWQAATIASARGGRRAHPPKILSMLKEKKINKKEKRKAFLSALAMIASAEEIKKKYKTLEDKKIEVKLPIIIEDKILNLKTKEFFQKMKLVLNELFDVVLQKRAVRAGKGKMRGRKYKKSAGLLFVVGNKEEKKIQGIEIKKADQVSVSDIASNGARLVIFTENAINELGDKFFGEKKKNKQTKTEKIKEEDKKIKIKEKK